MEAESGRVLDRFFERWIYGSDIPRIRYSSTDWRQAGRRALRTGRRHVFDMPVTVTLTYADGRTSDVVVPVTEAVWSSAPSQPTGVVRQVQVNQDSAALAEFVEG